MPTDWRVGQTVKHPKFGIGRVESVLAAGQKLRIYFESVATSKTILAEFFEPTPHVPSEPVHPQPTKSHPGDQGDARLVLECLRQGLPPPGKLQLWTVGLQEVRTQIGAALADAADRGKGHLLVVEGGYGQGKSHIGRWARELALSRQVATMNTELDGGGISLANSRRLLTSLFSSLVLPDGRGAGEAAPGLGTLLKDAARGQVLPRGTELFRPLLEHAHFWEGNEEAVEVLEDYLSGGAKGEAEYRLRALGMHVVLPALGVNYGSLGDRLVAQAEQLARVVSLTRESGSKGALIVIDELDHEFGGSDAHHRHRALETVRAWSQVFSRKPVIMLLLAPPGLPEWPSCRRIGLPLLRIEELKALTGRVVEAFRKVKPGLLVNDGVDRLFARILADFNERFKDEGWGPRYFVRATVEACERAVEKQAPLGAVLG